MDELQQQGTEIFNDLAERLLDTLGLLTQPYVPSSPETRHLEAALAHLIAVFDSRGFLPAEEAVWNCGSITIAGKHRGAWEIKLRQTDAQGIEARRAVDAEGGAVGDESPVGNADAPK